MSASTTAVSSPKSKPPYLLKVLRCGKRPKKTRIIAYRVDETMFETLQSFTAGASAIALQKVSFQHVIDAALSNYMAASRAKSRGVDGDLADGDEIEVEAIAAE